jgi:hypothetical protein
VCFVAVFAAQLPLPPDPERAGAASLIGRLHEAALGFVMLATVPFLVGFFLGGERQRRFLRSASLVVAMLLIVYSFPSFVHTLIEGCQRLGAARATLVVRRSGLARAVGAGRGRGARPCSWAGCRCSCSPPGWCCSSCASGAIR